MTDQQQQIIDTLEATLIALDSILTTMCFTPHFQRNHLEQDHVLLLAAFEKLAKLKPRITPAPEHIP